MSEFSANAGFLDKDGLYPQYWSIVSTIENERRNISDSIRKLNRFRGFGLEEYIRELENHCETLKNIQNDVTMEWNSLRKIIETVNEGERKAIEVFGGESAANLKNYSFSKNEGIVITHEDWGKLIKQFKYYSQRNDATKRFYEWLFTFYNLNKDTEFTPEFYNEIKDIYNMLIHKNDGEAFAYSDIEFCYTDLDGGYGWKKNLEIYADGSFETGLVKYTSAFGYGGDTTEWTITIGAVSGAVTFDASALSNLSEVDFNYLKAKLTNGKFSLDNEKDKDDLKIILGKAGIDIGADITGLTISNVCKKKIDDRHTLYNEMVITVGEVYAKAGGVASADTKDGFTLKGTAKAGANIAKIETKTGVIVDDVKVTVDTGATAGVEVGGSVEYSTKKKSGHADIGSLSGGFEFSEYDIDKYIFI